MLSKEDYITYDVARLLKEKGYNGPCKTFWCEMYHRMLDCSSKGIAYSNVIYDFLEEGDILMPSLYEAQKWLREKSFIVSVDYNEVDGWYYSIYALDCSRNGKHQFENYESALNEGIKKALEFI